MVGRVGEGGPRARMPDRGARNRLAYEVTAGGYYTTTDHTMYGFTILFARS